MIVIDASAGVEFLLGTARGGLVGERLIAGGRIHVPHLFDVEVLSALRRLMGSNVIDANRARTALDALRDLPVERHPHWPLQERVWGLRANVSACDATYVALAEALGAPLVTADKRLGRVPGLDVAVQVVG